MTTTNKHNQEKDSALTEDTKISLNFKGLWALVATVITGTIFIVSYQLKMEYKIESMYLKNEAGHESIMTKLTEIDRRQDMFVLKRQVEDAIVFVTEERDKSMGTNMIAKDSINFRMKIRDFLK